MIMIQPHNGRGRGSSGEYGNVAIIVPSFVTHIGVYDMVPLVFFRKGIM